MPDYSLTKIYKLISNYTDKVYAGHTTYRLLSQRLSKHKAQFKRWLKNSKKYCASYELFKLGHVEIVLLESYPCDNFDEARMKEQEWIDMLGEKCLNMRHAFITKEELKQLKQQQNQQYWNDHKEEIKQREQQPHSCLCGGRYTHTHQARHFCSKQHQAFIQRNKIVFID